MPARARHRYSAAERVRAGELSRVWRARHRKTQRELAVAIGSTAQDVGLLERVPEAASSVVVRKVLERLGGAE